MIDYEKMEAAIAAAPAGQKAVAAVDAMIPAAVKGSCAPACPFNGRDFCGLGIENKYASTNKPGLSCPASKNGGG